MNLNLKLIPFTLSLLAALSAPALAQDGWSGWNSTVQNNISNDIMWGALRSNVYSSGGASSFQVDMLTLGTQPSNMSRAEFDVPIDPAVRQAALADFFESLEAIDPALAAQIRPLDVFATMTEGLSQYGLSTNNFVDALTSYVIELYGAANGEANIQPTLVEVDAVRQQMINMVAQMATPQEMMDRAAMQSASDELLLRAMLVNLLNMRATYLDDAEQSQQLRREVAALTQASFGVDFSQTTLTSQGLALR